VDALAFAPSAPQVDALAPLSAGVLALLSAGVLALRT
jgi:hypothetical protein